LSYFTNVTTDLLLTYCYNPINHPGKLWKETQKCNTTVEPNWMWKPCR